MKSQSWKIVMILAGIGWSAGTSQATLIVYEGFDYGQTTQPLAGLGGSELGLSGTWANNTSSNGSGSVTRIYDPAGLTFANLPVTGGNLLMLNPTSEGANYAQRQHSASVVTGGTLWGSYLYQPIYDNTSPLLTTVTALFNANVENASDTNPAVTFVAQGKQYNTNGLGGLQASAPSAINTGIAIAVGTSASPTSTTYLVLFRIANIGTASATATEWILTEAQFANLVLGGVTEAELDGLVTGSGSGNVLQKGIDVGGTTTTFNASTYFNFQSHGKLGTGFDELRISNASGDTGLAEVTPIPEPATLGLMALGGLMMANRYKR